MRKPHWMEKCGGDPVSVSYAPPGPLPKAWGLAAGEAARLIDEYRHGVTVVSFRCKRCEKVFENRYLGDQRDRFEVED